MLIGRSNTSLLELEYNLAYLTRLSIELSGQYFVLGICGICILRCVAVRPGVYGCLCTGIRFRGDLLVPGEALPLVKSSRYAGQGRQRGLYH